MITPKDIVMGKEQIDEIFQVNINSKKLIAILKRLEDNYQKIESKVTKIDQYCRDSTSVLNTKIINSTQVFKDMIDCKIKEAILMSQKRIQTQTQGLSTKLQQKFKKIDDVQNTIQAIKQIINHANDNVTNEIQNQIQHFSSQIVSLKKYIENLQGQILKKIESFRSEIIINKQNFLQMEGMYKKLTDQINSSMNADFASQNGRKFQDSSNLKRYSQVVPSEVSQNEKQFKRKQKPKSKTKKSQVKVNGTPINSISKSNNSQSNRLNQDYFTAISAKVDNLQKVVQQQTQKFQIQTLRQSALKRKPKNAITKTVSYTKEEFEILCNDQQSAQQNIDKFSEEEMLSNILKRLSGIGSLMESKQKKLKKTIDQVKQKFLMFEEKHEFNKQRIAKLASQVQQFKVKFTQQLEKKSETSLDQNRISTLQNQIGRVIQRLDHERNSKNSVEIEEYNLDKNKTMEKFKIIHEILVYKAQKDDVKKAISFLEEKIKQIILVMAHEFNEQKLGAINKQQVKCLTCDKQIFKQENVSPMARTSAKGFTHRKRSVQSSRTHLTRLLSPKKLNQSSIRRDRLNYTVLTQMPEQKVQISPFE